MGRAMESQKDRIRNDVIEQNTKVVNIAHRICKLYRLVDVLSGNHGSANVG